MEDQHFLSHVLAYNINTEHENIHTRCIQVLRSPKEAFVAAMQSRRERCEKCVCLQGDYVEK